MSGEQLDTRPGDLIQRPILEPGNVTVVADLWGAHGHRNNQPPTAQKNPFMLFVAVGLTLCLLYVIWHIGTQEYIISNMVGGIPVGDQQNTHRTVVL